MTTYRIPAGRVSVFADRPIGQDPYPAAVDDTPESELAIVLVAGWSIGGYRVDYLPPGFESGGAHGIPHHVGPYAWIRQAPVYEGVLGDLDRADRRGLVYRAEIGDRIEVDRQVFQIRTGVAERSLWLVYTGRADDQ